MEVSDASRMCVCVCVLTLKVSEIWIVLEVVNICIYIAYICACNAVCGCGVCWYSVPTSSTAVMTLVRPAI